MEHTTSSSSLTTLYLRHASTAQTTLITISRGGGVDIGLVSRAFGLNPNSLRLNGYHVSRAGPEHVSSSLSWAQLLDFFAQRGLPRGTGKDEDAIVVQGKFLRHTDNNSNHLKRKLQLETGSSLKKTRLETSVQRPSKNKTVNIKKRLNSEDSLESFLKKIKIAEADTGTQESYAGAHVEVELETERSLKKTKLDNLVLEPSKNKTVRVKKRGNPESSLESFVKKIKIAESGTGIRETCTSTHIAQITRVDHKFVSVNTR